MYLPDLEWGALGFAFLMALFDVVMLGIIKAYNVGMLKGVRWMILPTIAYALQPWIFLKSLSLESMIVMNLLWDLVSDILVTANGFLFFKERLTNTKTMGVLLSLVSMYLLSCKESKLC